MLQVYSIKISPQLDLMVIMFGIENWLKLTFLTKIEIFIKLVNFYSMYLNKLMINHNSRISMFPEKIIFEIYKVSFTCIILKNRENFESISELKFLSTKSYKYNK